MGTWEAELFIEPVPGSVVVTKPRFDVWQSREFLDYLAADPVDGFVIAGVELRCCVLFASFGADEHGYHFVVPQDLVSGLDLGDDTYNLAARHLLVSLLTIDDLMHEGQKIISVSYRSLEVYLAIALVYLVLTQVTNYALHRVERRLRAGGMVQ